MQPILCFHSNNNVISLYYVLIDVKKPSVNLAFALTTDGALDSHNGWGDDEDGWDWWTRCIQFTYCIVCTQDLTASCGDS